jgi:hypothetical protein
VAGAWGAPPWRSRFVGRWAGARIGPHRRVGVALVAGLAIVGAVVSIADSGAHAAALLVAGLGAEATLAAAASAVHQWRFAPRRRAREGAVVTLAALATAAVMTGLGQEAVGVQAVTIILAVVVALVLAWPLDPARFGSVRSRSASAARSPASSPGD